MQGRGTKSRGPARATVGRRPRMTAKKRGNGDSASSQGHFSWSGPRGNEDLSPTVAPTPDRSGDNTSDSDAGSAPAAALGPPDGANEEERAECDADEFPPGHPWHYLERGDNAAPVPAAAIPPSPRSRAALESDLPKQPARRIVAARTLLDLERERLAAAIHRYDQIVEHGVDALGAYDRTIAYRGDPEMARAESIACLYNQIAWWKGRIDALERETDRGGTRGR